MKKVLITFCGFALLAVVCTGCNKRKDPKENPNFNEAAGASPGSVKMEPIKGGSKSPGT